MSIRLRFDETLRDMLPNYLRFVKGIIDTKELPLNVSREMLQKTPDQKQRKAPTFRKPDQLVAALTGAQAGFIALLAFIPTFIIQFVKVIIENVRK